MELVAGKLETPLVTWCSERGSSGEGTCDSGGTPREAFISEIHEFLTGNNPSTIWRPERERGLLDRGLGVLVKEQREFLVREWEENSMEERNQKYLGILADHSK